MGTLFALVRRASLLFSKGIWMKVLVTGFEPFGADSINASWEAVRRLPKRTAGIDIVAKCVPVVFGDAARIVEGFIEREQPDAVLCAGVAAGRAQVTPEYVAINHRHARIADNEGFQPYDEPMVAGLPMPTLLPRRFMPWRRRAASRVYLRRFLILRARIAATTCSTACVILRSGAIPVCWSTSFMSRNVLSRWRRRARQSPPWSPLWQLGPWRL